MRIVALIARILLGLIFLVFGANLIHSFLPMPTPPPGLQTQFMTVMFGSHYMFFIGLVQFIGGLLLIINRFVPLALVLLGPVIVNILLFHGLMAPSGLPLALLVLSLWAILAWQARRNFAGIFTQRIDA
ncbi:MAG TPA: DoxX family membrane protein [Candidatus Acidoferrum sp.]|nr:DoxX family membrane protein [Candidatus Acidoferrum sp.]